MKKLLLILFIVSSFVAEVNASRIYAFTSIDNDDGLSSNCVKAILRDSYNFMWFGTKNGLDRYDGHSLRHFNCYDTQINRGNNNIGALYEDKDHNIWVGTDRGVYIFNQMTETFSFVNLKNKDGIGVEDYVESIIGDCNGNVWVLAPNQGLFRFNSGKVDYHSITNNPGTKGHIPTSLCATADGEIYVGTAREGIYRYNADRNSFTPVGQGFASLDPLRNKVISHVRESNRGKLTVFTETGSIYRINTKTLESHPVEFSGEGHVFVRATMACDDEIWVGTQNGIYIINQVDHSERYLTVNSPETNGMTDNIIYTIYSDSDNNVWLGTMFGGVNFYQRDGFAFERYLTGPSEQSLSSSRIRGIAEGSDGMLYIGTEYGGLNKFNPATGTVERLDRRMGVYPPALTVRRFGNNIYYGVSREGLEVFTPGNPSPTHEATNLLSDHTSAYAILIDKRGDMWLGADWGLFRRRKGSTDFERISEIGTIWVFDLMEDSKGRIWIAGMGDGVWIYDPSNSKFHHYPYDESHSNGLCSNSVSAITEDSHGNIWISTDRGGLSCYDPKHDNFRTIGIEDGLPDNVVYNLLEDSRGFLWFGTNKGLVKYDPQTGHIKVFTVADGLPCNQFNYHAVAKGNDGYFYFGTINGLVAFNPDLDNVARPTPIYFTSLRMGNHEVVPGEDGSPIKTNLMFANEIELPYSASHFTIGVSSPVYGNRGGVAYTYRLTPTSDSWIGLPDDRTISFTSLAPGDYRLDVRAEADGKETIQSIDIHVDRPWYTTIWAWLIYLLLLGALGFGIWTIWKRRRIRTQREREFVFKMQTEKELYENKVKFFSEIAHEIRTPLTLIETPLEAIEEIGINDDRIDRYLKMMRKNTSRLLDLVSQLLDFQKMGNDREKLNFEFVNISSLVSETAARFQDSITLRNKNLTLNLPETPVQAMVDKEAVTKIISNLLSNAMKYGNKEIVASLTSDGTRFSFSVRSDGKKIVGEDVYSIFTPFYQIKVDSDLGGVGIGLPLSRFLASMHNGSLELEIDNNPENTFTLTLPLKQEGIETPLTNADPLLTEYVMEEEPQQPVSGSGNSMLLVEDNAEMRSFLHEQLSRYFVIETAENGVEALKMLSNNRYDIIVTDIMMPEMDGYELCSKVKEDVELSHIPVVFLTAKNDLDSKVRALKCGGEAYIEKPFSIKFFRQQVLSLLENRRHERRSLIKKPFFTVDNMQMSKADEEFMNKVVKTIQDHIADENFNVESMADVLCMSRSSLLRKIKALFSLSPVELIRLVKLKKSAELIKEGKYRIGDICFMVGINSPSYFSKLFLKQFGMTPKAFEMQCQKNARSGSSNIESTDTNKIPNDEI